jgi:hypothetical protein
MFQRDRVEDPLEVGGDCGMSMEEGESNED